MEPTKVKNLRETINFYFAKADIYYYPPENLVSIGNLKRSHPNGESSNPEDVLAKRKRFRLIKSVTPPEITESKSMDDDSLPDDQFLSERSKESTTPSSTPEPYLDVVFPCDFPDHLKTLVNLDNMDLQNELDNERAQKVMPQKLTY
jgi:hypothetical protein